MKVIHTMDRIKPNEECLIKRIDKVAGREVQKPGQNLAPKVSKSEQCHRLPNI
jgi:hypothetical protein